ncbi:MAG: DUF4131 domain-containing protein [Alteraurantiacibacter sp.]|nr:DUF4131 domain-containing protein [Alteraurantiacibacter sp.]
MSSRFLSYSPMATRNAPLVPMGEETGDAAMRQTPWRIRAALSSTGDAVERFLEQAGYDRGPWIAVALGGGIATWLALPAPAWSLLALAAAGMTAMGTIALWKGREDRARLMQAIVTAALSFAAGMCLVWARSAVAGVPGIERPFHATFMARVLERIEQPAEDRIRLVVAMRHPQTAQAMKVRLNLPLSADDARIRTGAVLRLSARLMPPAPPMLPGSYNFARAAWFAGYAATGSVTGKPQVIAPGTDEPLLAAARQALSTHVRERVDGAAGAVAATLASGDRGAISKADEQSYRQFVGQLLRIQFQVNY